MKNAPKKFRIFYHADLDGSTGQIFDKANALGKHMERMLNTYRAYSLSRGSERCRFLSRDFNFK